MARSYLASHGTVPFRSWDTGTVSRTGCLFIGLIRVKGLTLAALQTRYRGGARGHFIPFARCAPLAQRLTQRYLICYILDVTVIKY